MVRVATVDVVVVAVSVQLWRVRLLLVIGSRIVVAIKYSFAHIQ